VGIFWTLLLRRRRFPGIYALRVDVPRAADAVVAGAGIAGIATAFHLTVRLGVGGVVICDPRPPLTLTSDKSTECYRTWWPNAPMVSLMQRSVDLLEELAVESGDALGLNRRGYLYVTADPGRLEGLRRSAEAASAAGAGNLRVHRGVAGDPSYSPSPASGWAGVPDGADLFLDGDTLRRHFPYLTERALGGLHARRAGWFSAQQLGAWMLEQARRAGAVVVAEAVTGIETGGGVRAVRLAGGSRIETPTVIDAAGPMLAEVGRLAGVELPVHHEVHHKVAFRDPLGVVPRDAPMMIWNDPQHLAWDPSEREMVEEAGLPGLLGEMPPACHGRPEGGPDSPWVLALWEYRRTVHTEPVFPLPEDPLYPEVVLRGMTAMLPRLAAYLEHLPWPVVDGGYYTKTVENRPLVGPAGPDGFVVCGALSGFGVMAASAAGELAALHVTGGPLPEYAPAFSPDRYGDPAYLEEISQVADTGQL
jgi:sarcosine oxidase, subunit beta